MTGNRRSKIEDMGGAVSLAMGGNKYSAREGVVKNRKLSHGAVNPDPKRNKRDVGYTRNTYYRLSDIVDDDEEEDSDGLLSSKS